jgi:hypothetical protein
VRPLGQSEELRRTFIVKKDVHSTAGSGHVPTIHREIMKNDTSPRR